MLRLTFGHILNHLRGPLAAGQTGNPDAFPVVMAALLYAIDTYGDLMRMSISPPGNDFRLGAMEAPPAVISTYLGEDMTAYLKRFMASTARLSAE